MAEKFSSHPIILFLLFTTLPSILCEERVEVFKKFGDRVELTCDIEKMDRNIAVRWSRDDDFVIKVDMEGTKKNEIFKHIDYELDPLTSALKFTVNENTTYHYQCVKSTKGSEFEKNYQVSAIGKVKCDFPTEADLQEGKAYHFNATITFSGYEPTDHWVIGDRTVKASGEPDIAFDIKALHYTALSDDDGKNLTLTYSLGDNKEICTRKLSILHPPKKVVIQAGDAVEKGSKITCTSDGNPKADISISDGKETLAKGVSKAVYTVLETSDVRNITVTCHAKNKFSTGNGISTTKAIQIIEKASVKGSATWPRCSMWGLAWIIIMTTIFKN